MPSIAPATVGDLPRPELQIGDRSITDTSGGVHRHVYAATGAPTVDVPLAGEQEIDSAVAAARAALPGWRNTTADQRRNALAAMGRLIAENAERLSRINTIDNGSPILITTAQNHMAADLSPTTPAGPTRAAGRCTIPGQSVRWITASMNRTAWSA